MTNQPDMVYCCVQLSKSCTIHIIAVLKDADVLYTPLKYAWNEELI